MQRRWAKSSVVKLNQTSKIPKINRTPPAKSNVAILFYETYKVLKAKTAQISVYLTFSLVVKLISTVQILHYLGSILGLTDEVDISMIYCLYFLQIWIHYHDMDTLRNLQFPLYSTLSKTVIKGQMLDRTSIKVLKTNRTSAAKSSVDRLNRTSMC